MRLASLDYGQLIQRGVSAPVARFITAERHPIRNVGIFVRPIDPHWDYYIPPGAEDVLGLWDENADAYCRWMRAGLQEFVVLHHDDPEHTLVAWTEQGLLAELVRQYHEHLDWQNEASCLEQVRAFADYVGFRHTDRLVAYLASDSDTTDFLGEFRALFGSLQ
jgi:hypothetical protein